MARQILSFDLTGTLATFRYCDAVWFEGLPRLYARTHGLPVEQAREYLVARYDEVGDEVPEWYDIRYWFDRFSLGIGWDEVLREFVDEIEFFPETLAVLEACSREYELIMITNAAREFAEVETAPIGHYFSRIISSVSDFGEVKKTPEFYARVCESLGRESREITHVGDHWQFDFVAPRGNGLRAFYLDRAREQTGDFVIHDLSELEAKLL